MASYKNASNAKKGITVDTFLGLDLTNSFGNINTRRSPDAPNMIRDTIGRIKKRCGYKVTHTFNDKINGVHFYTKNDISVTFVHSGTTLYKKVNENYEIAHSGLNNEISKSIQFGGYLLIIDGLRIIAYNGEKIVPLDTIGYLPTVVIGRQQEGGGQAYEPINMLNDFRIEKYSCATTDTLFHLATQNIHGVEYVKYLRNGEWENVYNGYITVDRFAGTVKVNYSPQLSVNGEATVEICYEKRNYDYKKIINSSNIFTLYGMNGALDRIFLAGNSQYKNRDYYSQINDPTYWPDTNYSIIGRDDRPIMGYSVVSDKLATHKQNEENNANIIFRVGEMFNNDVLFRVVGTCSSMGAIAKNSFGTLDNEPVYLSDEGICAITVADVLGERICQVRSYFLNGKLLKEKNLKDAACIYHNKFYYLCVNNTVYILDSMQSASDNNNLFSHRQYEGYYWTNLPVRLFYLENNQICFGTNDGKICCFKTQDEQNCYLDDTKPYESYWQTVFFHGDNFIRKKTIMQFNLLLSKNPNDVSVEYREDDTPWKEVIPPCPNSKSVISKRVHIKDVKNISFKIKNINNSGLSLEKYGFDYIDGGKIK